MIFGILVKQIATLFFQVYKKDTVCRNRKYKFCCILFLVLKHFSNYVHFFVSTFHLFMFSTFFSCFLSGPENHKICSFLFLNCFIVYRVTQTDQVLTINKQTASVDQEDTSTDNDKIGSVCSGSGTSRSSFCGSTSSQIDESDVPLV